MKPTSQLLTETSVRLGDSANSIWSVAELLRYLNDAQNILCRETKCFWKQAYLNDQEDVGDAILPTDVLQIDRATWDSLPLDIVSVEHLQRIDKRYRELQGRVLKLGLDIGKVQKFRVPSVTITSAQPDSHAPTTDIVENTRIEYFAALTTLTSAGMIDLPQSYTKYMRYYILWHAYERDGPGQDLKLADHFNQRWLVGLARIKTVRNRVIGARTRYIGGGGTARRKPAYPVYPPEYGRIVRG